VILSEGETFFVEEAWLTRATPKVAVASALLPRILAGTREAMIEVRCARPTAWSRSDGCCYETGRT